MRISFLLLCGCLFSAYSFAQTPLKISSPRTDSLSTTTQRFYITGIASPYGKLFVRDNEIHIYSTGAFAAGIDLTSGRNTIPVKLVLNNDTIFKNIIVNYSRPLPPKPTLGLAIESAKTVPAQDQWLQAGERMEVEVKATPGKKLSFFRDIPMEEVSPAITGIAGIYRGEYLIKPGDTLTERNIRFTLTDPTSGKTVSSYSKQKISFIDNSRALVGTTTGKPYLTFGLGEDRLGGAKMGYIDTAIRLQVIGKTGSMYRVKLSEEMEAYIPTENLNLLTSINFVPKSLTGSWSVTTDGKSDFLSVGLDQRLPYSTIQEINPSRIVLDIYGAVSNTNWITQKDGLSAIKNVWYNQIAKDVFRVYIELKDPIFWGYDVYYRGTALTVKVKARPTELNISKLTFGVDAGHGGSNAGADGLTGSLERNITLAVAKKLRNKLISYGSNVYMTRENDTSFSNSERAAWMKTKNPDMLISIHCNSSSNPLVEGTSTYYKHIGFRPLSQFIQPELLKLGLKDFGNIGNFNFFFNAPTEYPSVLVETGFISNPADEERLLSPPFQDSLASAIVKGIENFLASDTTMVTQADNKQAAELPVTEDTSQKKSKRKKK